MDGDGARVADPLFAGGGELGRVMASQDWSATPLGPPEQWSPALRSVVRILLTSRFSMWMAWGPELTVLYNDAYRRDTLRAKHPWALGRPAREVWAEIWDDIGPRIDSVLGTGVATWDEGLRLFLERAGYVEETFHTFSYSPLSEADGRVVGMLCVVSEDTERVLGERRLRVLSELGDVSAVTAPTVEQACRSALSVLARSRTDLPFASIYLHEDGVATRIGHYGLADDERVVPSRIERALRPVHPLWTVLDSGRPEVRTGLAADHGDRMVPLDGGIPDEVVVVPLTGSGGGDPVGVLFAGTSPFRALDEEYRRFVDLVAGQVSNAIADAQALQHQRRRADELAELDRAKTEFFTGVSHELRTPLTLIAGPAEDALADDVEPLGPAQRDRVEVIARNGGRLRRLVDTILEFARLEGGRLTPDVTAVDLAALTRGIAESFAPAVVRAGLGFVVDAPELGSAVAVDVDMWEKIVLNLLSNAVKFTHEGTVTLTLRPGADGGVVLRVADTGIGIPESDLPLLFQRFHRVHGAAGRSHEGSGIGLALVAELTGLHGGAVEVASEVGAGSAFTVALPPSALTGEPAVRRRASSAVELYREEALQWSGAEPGDTDPAAVPVDAGAAAGATVLVVEDNPDLRRFIAGLLEPHYRVLRAADGQDALYRARTAHPDLVLTDVMMPGLDGFALLAALRSHPSTATTPVIMLSARAGEEAAIEGLSAGADDYLVKPFSSADLLARVRSNLLLARERNRESAWRTALFGAIQDGLFVLDAEGAVVEMNGAMAAMLGHPATGVPYPVPHPWWPDPVAHPAEAAQVRAAFTALRDSDGGRVVLPMRHPDGRRVWIETVIDAMRDRDGTHYVGTVRDITEQRRAAERDQLLADAGRLLAEPGELAARLTALAGAAAPVLGGRVEVALVGSDGRATTVATAPAPADRAPGERLVVALQARDERLGTLVVDPAADPHLVEELARRTALAVDAERRAERERHLRGLTAALSAASSVHAVATVLTDRMRAALGARAAAALLPRSDALELVHADGYPEGSLRTVEHVPLGADLPVAECARTAELVAFRDDEEMAARHPQLAAEHTGTGGGAFLAVPLVVGDHVAGVLAISFAGRRAFDAGERAFVTALAGEAGRAFERAALADQRRELAETLQRSLLPGELPELEDLTLAARYLPAAAASQTGGDWYDVIPLDGRRVAIVVGDVVGQGPAAAAVMGQLRSALSAYLLQSGSPADALTWLDRYSHRVRGARASTVVCLVLDRASGELRWARAGHPSPLVVDPDGSSRYLDEPQGTVLGLTGGPPFGEARTTLPPGSTVLLYTDGLVERRAESLDEGFDRLAAAAAERATEPVDRLVPGVLDAALDGAGPADDVAVLVARRRPPPCVLRFPAHPAELRRLRREIGAWAWPAALPAESVEDLELAVGEAVSNAVEHAYTGREPGEVHVRLEARADGAVRAEVRDSGTWRPVPADPGHRGRGLLVMRRLAEDFDVDGGEHGTTVRFVLPPAPPAAPAGAPARRRPPAADPAHPLLLRADTRDGRLCLRLVGEMDFGTVPRVREELLARVTGADGPVELDLRGVTQLLSAGVALLAEARASGDVRLVHDDPGPVARVLRLAGLAAGA